MKLQIIVVCLVVLGTLQGSAAQDWSSWMTSRRYWITSGNNNKDVQYRWRASTPGGNEECQVQLRDLKRQPNQTTVVSVRIDYQYHDAESTRDVVTITDIKGENQGEATLYHCTSVGDVQLTDIVR
jgi:lipopolysaccharide biosynthesis regulator YciM